MKLINIVGEIVSFYLKGFKGMRIGKTLWVIIGIKFLIFFVIMKWLFFPNYLNENFKNDQERSEHVLNNLTKGE